MGGTAGRRSRLRVMEAMRPNPDVIQGGYLLGHLEGVVA